MINGGTKIGDDQVAQAATDAEPNQITENTSPSDVNSDVGHGDRLDGSEPVARPRNRRDIDGLRAIAVIPVLLFHAGVPYFSAGFIGVDIFFVISGFLITAIIDRELRENEFSIVRFYERRARRLLPALYVMMAVVAVLSWLMFLPKDLEDTGQSLVATATYMSNLLFYIKTNYFGIAALNKPLLHTWSLAVEEHFYIIFPPLMLALSRYTPSRMVPIVASLFAASLALSTYGAREFPAATFYLPLTRFWELMLGSLLVMLLGRGMLRRRSSELASLLGLALIIGSMVLLNEQSPFPGLAALPVCLGTGLIIFAGAGDRKPLVSRFLALPPLVIVGLMSYSIYLWHWPAIVFARYYTIRPLTSVELSLLLVLIVALSAFSWRYFERPVRHGYILRSRIQLFGAAGLGLLLFGGAGLAMHFSGGFPGRLPSLVLALDAQREPHVTKDCGAPPGAPYGAKCKIGEGVPQFLVWGDSHSGSLRPAFELAARRAGSGGLLLTANGCAPVLNVEFRQFGRERNRCGEYNEEVIQLIKLRKIRDVFLVADWRNYTSTSTFKSGDLKRGLSGTLQALSDRNVFLIERIPGARGEVASAMARSLLFNRPIQLNLTVSEVDELDRPSKAVFSALALQFPFRMVDPKTRMCRDGFCAVDSGGVPLYSDAAHLTPASGPILEPLLTPLLMAGRTCQPPSCSTLP